MVRAVGDQTIGSYRGLVRFKSAHEGAGDNTAAPSALETPTVRLGNATIVHARIA